MTSAKQSSTYPPEFRAEAVQLARTSGKLLRADVYQLEGHATYHDEP